MTAVWAQASRPLSGQSQNGDACWADSRGGVLRLAVIDGLGHGAEAALAAELAVQTLQEAPQLPLSEQLQRCHAALRRTRGAAMSLAEIDLEAGRLRWCGVGNVEGLLLSSGQRQRLLAKSGIVGFNLPSPHLGELPAGPGDALLLCTDGIHLDFIKDFDPRLAPGDSAARILRNHARDSDDALVLVARLS